VEWLEATQHAHLDGSQLSEAEREAMTEPGRVVAGQPEPSPVATDEDLSQLYDSTGPTVVDAFRAIYDLGRQHGARAAAQPAPAALAESVSVLDAKAWAYIGRQAILGDPDAQSLVDLLSDPPAAQPEPAVKDSLTAGPKGLLVEREVVTGGPQPEPLTNVTGKGVIVEGQFDYSGTTYVYRAKAQPAPAVKESLTDAPAGSLVERVMVLLGHHGDGTARAALRVVAAWLRVESKGHLGSGAHWAHRMEQEADQ
jgi:hypothetical protein